MKVRNIIHKAAVLGASATMLGATAMGALAYELSDYPMDYIVDGSFDGKIVIGEKAATADVLGAIDIAASLQARSLTQEEVEIPGQAGEVSLSGDAFRIETSSDLLEIREVLGDVYDTLTEAELEALQGGSITTDEGNTDYNQYLRLADSSSTTLQQMAVNFVEESEGNVLGDFLVIDTSLPFFEWEIEFSEGLESSSSNSELSDLEDEVFNIFGTDFTFVDSDITASGNYPVTLSFMAGDVSDTLREGETKTYTVDGVDYEVTAVFISDPSTSTPEAKFAVNGELTDGLGDGQTDTLNSGLQIGVRDLLVNSREGVVEFFLGANKIEISDSDTSADNLGGTVEIGNERIEDADAGIVGNAVGSDKFEINSIKYQLTVDAAEGSTVYVPPGAGVREFLDEPEGMLSPTFDLRYEGLKEVTSTPVDFDARSDHSYDLQLTNLRGKEYEFPFITNKGDIFKFGDDDDDFVFIENNVNVTAGSWDAADFNIGDNDYFALSEHNITNADYKDDSAIMRYEDIDTSDQLLTFTDLSSGESRTVSYTTDTTDTDLLGTVSNFIVEGTTHTVWVGNATGNPIAVDLDGNGASVDNDAVGFTIKSGATVDFMDATLSTATLDDTDVGNGQSMDQTDRVNLDLTTPGDVFDGTTGESFGWSVAPGTDSGDIDMAFNASSFLGPHGTYGSSDIWAEFDVMNDDADEDWDRGMSDFGGLIEYYNPSGSNDANELTISYPESQVGAQVFVVAGVTERSSSGAGGVMRDMINPIAIGMAVLDINAGGMLGSENLIIVGGPCANTVAADFLGNPADCAEGFEPGKAMISARDIDESVATLVAGYEAQETLGASYVLADYETYLADVSGGEVEVIASDLSDLQVMVAE